MTAGEPRCFTVRVGALVCAVALVLAACSGGGGHRPAGLPAPVRGKVVPFDLDGLGSEDLDADFPALEGLVASDAAGNVYVVRSRFRDQRIVRITPGGEALPYLSLDGVEYVSKLAVLRGGAMVVSGPPRGSDGPPELFSVRRNGSVSPLASSHVFQDPFIVGEYPPGSLVVRDDSGLWTVHNGQATRLLVKGGSFRPGTWTVVDPSGTLYAVGDTLGTVRVLPAGKAPHSLAVTGRAPGSAQELAKLQVMAVIPASVGGFYAVASEASDPYYVVYVAPAGAGVTVLAQLGPKTKDCTLGKAYPAFHNSCEPSGFLAEGGSRLLSLGYIDPTDPSLVLPAVGL